MMTTLSQVLEKLRLKKYDNEFRFSDGKFGAPSGKQYEATELNIIRTYRFEGDSSDPSDSSVIYLIEANDGLIGYSIDAYGAYSNHDNEEGYDDFLRAIPAVEKEEADIY
ncbi:MAG: hypothetical protein H7296_14205 [Bacteroidia bacterium]|nr:hypothetical protein [Bacteroidia bacterium]